jgi:hypothetical protein
MFENGIVYNFEQLTLMLRIEDLIAKIYRGLLRDLKGSGHGFAGYRNDKYENM